VEKAPAKLIEEQRAKLSEAKEKVTKIGERLKTL
jgi:valyl-tRNA synthetase